MKKLLLLGICLLLTQKSIGQSIQSLPNRLLTANVGYGRAGTGDIYGVQVGFEYEKKFRPRLSWSTEFATTIHDGEDLFLVQLEGRPQEDMSYRFNTTGLQLAGKLGYHFLTEKRTDFGVKLGVLARYQTSTLSSNEILFPALTGYPLPVRILRNNEPQRTIAAGGLFQLFGRYTFQRNIALGATAGMQFDTNGDIIFPQFSLTIGKRF
jgi:hypothetical protein